MTTQVHGIHIVLISGSVRPGNYTGKALALVTSEIRKHPDIAAEQIDPRRDKPAAAGDGRRFCRQCPASRIGVEGHRGHSGYAGIPR